MSTPSIIIDHKIPYIQGVFEPYAAVKYLSPQDIDVEQMRETDILITRTRTQCNATLLAGSRCQFIGTATIGFDHIDTAYCEQQGIVWCNAPGCNASSVAQYIASVLTLLQQRDGWQWGECCIGIVGVGHVGSQVEQLCRALGMKVLLCDPPRAIAEGSATFVSLDEIAQRCHIITFHTPLTKSGEHATYHLADAPFLQTLQAGAVIINSSRGAVVDNRALHVAYCNGSLGGYVLDCWEGEPHIPQPLLEDAFIATPHIAGYSADGKCNASRAMVQAVANHLGIAIDTTTMQPPAPLFAEIDLSGIEGSSLASALLATYHPMTDMQPLLAAPESFEQLRGNYPLRREYGAYTLTGVPLSHRQLLQNLGFCLGD